MITMDGAMVVGNLARRAKAGGTPNPQPREQMRERRSCGGNSARFRRIQAIYKPVHYDPSCLELDTCANDLDLHGTSVGSAVVEAHPQRDIDPLTRFGCAGYVEPGL